METLTQYEMQPIHVLMLSILVLYLGFFLNRKIRFLSEFYIPPAVTGGLICSSIVAIVYGGLILKSPSICRFAIFYCWSSSARSA